MVANQLTFLPSPPEYFRTGRQAEPAYRQIFPSRSMSTNLSPDGPHVNGIYSSPPPTGTPDPLPSRARRPFPLLADFYTTLHSRDAEFASRLFLEAWDEDCEYAMNIILSLIYSKNGKRALVYFIQTLVNSHPNARADIIRFLMSANITEEFNIVT